LIRPMSHPLKASIKRGALIAAANWQVSVIQASADSLFKLLLAAPIVGGIFLMALAVGSEPASLLTLEWRQMAATIASSLMERPTVLTAFLLSVGVVAVGGSLFVFLVKAGTVATLVRSDRDAGPIEEPPLHASVVARASRFAVDSYVESARALFPRYARLGFVLPGEVGYVVVDENGTAQPVTTAEGIPVTADGPWYSRLWASLEAADVASADEAE